MSNKDYYSDISKNLKQQLDILKLNKEDPVEDNIIKLPDLDYQPDVKNVIKISDRQDTLNNTHEIDVKKSGSDNTFGYFNLYSNIILLIIIPIFIYISIYLIKPSYIYKKEKQNKNNIWVVDYNKLYFTILVTYIIILIFLFLQKQRLDNFLNILKIKFFN